MQTLNAFKRSLLTAFVGAASLGAPAIARGDDKQICIAAYDSTQAMRSAGHLQEAREQATICTRDACSAFMRTDCVKWLSEIDASQPTVVFDAKDAAGNDTSAVRVLLDGKPWLDHLEGKAVTIDPGDHTLTFETAGQPPVTKKLVIQQAQKDRREVITFAAPTTMPTDTASTPGASAVGTPATTEESHGMGTQKILALVAGGIGVVGLGVGAAFGVMAISQKSDAQSVCPNQCSTPDGVNKWSNAGATGNISTIGFIVGGVGVAGAAVLWFTAPSSARTQVGFGPGVLQVEGTW